jgi:hypothetical protein
MRLIGLVDHIRLEFQESGSQCLLHDCTLVHSSGIVSKFLANEGISLLSYPPFSADLAPADFIYFRN